MPKHDKLMDVLHSTAKGLHAAGTMDTLTMRDLMRMNKTTQPLGCHEDVDQEGGAQALLSVLRDSVEEQGMEIIAERVGISLESLYEALLPNADPTVKTLLAVIKAAGLKLVVHKSVAA